MRRTKTKAQGTKAGTLVSTLLWPQLWLQGLAQYT